MRSDKNKHKAGESFTKASFTKYAMGTSTESLPELTKIQERSFFEPFCTQRIASEPSILQILAKDGRRQLSIQKYLAVREASRDTSRTNSLVPSDTGSGSINSLEEFSKRRFKPIEKPARSGSIPVPRIPVLKPVASRLVTIRIDGNPSEIIRDATLDLKLNGFSVTLEELEEMYQVC